jgi:hypothetical protein
VFSDDGTLLRGEKAECGGGFWTPGVGYESFTSRKEPEVSQNNIDQGQTAETPTQETKTFIRQVRAATRRKYTQEDKIRIVLEGFRREVTVSDLCR